MSEYQYYEFEKRGEIGDQNRDLLAPAADAMLYRRGVGRLRSALDLPKTGDATSGREAITSARPTHRGAADRLSG